MSEYERYKDVPITVAFIGTLLVNIPQLYKTWQSKDVSGFSTYTMILRILINIAWIVFGVMESDVLIVIMSAEVSLCEFILVLFKRMYSRKSISNVQLAARTGIIREWTTGDNIQVLVASV